MLGGMVTRPAHGGGAIVLEARKLDLRDEAIVGDNGEKALRGERPADPAIILPASAVPAAARASADSARRWTAARLAVPAGYQLVG